MQTYNLNQNTSNENLKTTYNHGHFEGNLEWAIPNNKGRIPLRSTFDNVPPPPPPSPPPLPFLPGQ